MVAGVLIGIGWLCTVGQGLSVVAFCAMVAGALFFLGYHFVAWINSRLWRQ